MHFFNEKAKTFSATLLPDYNRLTILKFVLAFPLVMVYVTPSTSALCKQNQYLFEWKLQLQFFICDYFVLLLNKVILYLRVALFFNHHQTIAPFLYAANLVVCNQQTLTVIGRLAAHTSSNLFL